MKAIKINIEGASFLLPDTHQFYEFPTYILKHKAEIKKHVEAGKKLASDPLTNHFQDLPDMSEFKRITGIIGYPITMHDIVLYALDQKVEVVLEIGI